MRLILIICSLGFATPDLQEAARFNAKTKLAGEKLFQYDMASAYGSDIMTENWKHYDKYDLNGYVTIRDGKTCRIVYTGEYKGKPSAYYEVDLRKELGKSDTAFENNPPRELLGLERSMYGAERTANNAEIKLNCSANYNKILVPNDSGWSVYFLAATTQQGKVVVGGHYRIDIDSTGGRIIRTEQFTNSCLEMPLSSDDEGNPIMFITHLRSKFPNEVEYYLMLLHNLKLYVAIDKDLWFLTKDVIVYLGDVDKMKEKKKW